MTNYACGGNERIAVKKLALIWSKCMVIISFFSGQSTISHSRRLVGSSAREEVMDYNLVS